MGFKFNGRSADEFGLHVEHYPNYIGAKRKIETVEIPGRMEPLTIDEGTFELVSQEYEVSFYSKDYSPIRMREIREWLYSSAGFGILTDTYDPEVFRRARCIDEVEFENLMNSAGRATLSFECDPRYFLFSGQTPITFNSAGNLFNQHMPSRPLIRVTASGTGTATIGAGTLSVLANPTRDIYIDSDSLEIYNGSTDMASYVELTNDEFPELAKGNNVISFTGNISKIEITPRWWQP